jgi:hypothetical protein
MMPPNDQRPGAVSIERLRELLSYDPNTGALRWKARRHRRKVKRESAQYVRIQIEGRLYQAHRVAFAIHYGRWPLPEVDHADRDQSNNRIRNLREATRSQNAANVARSSRPTQLQLSL